MNKIVFVDDDARQTQNAKQYFKNKYEVITLNSPVDAMQQVEEIKPLCIISDYRMPKMTGMDFLIRCITLAPYSLRILVTAFPEDESNDSIKIALKSFIIHDFVPKPFSLKELDARIDHALDILKQKHDLENSKKNNLMLKDQFNYLNQRYMSILFERNTEKVRANRLEEELNKVIAWMKHRSLKM